MLVGKLSQVLKSSMLRQLAQMSADSGRKLQERVRWPAEEGTVTWGEQGGQDYHLLMQLWGLCFSANLQERNSSIHRRWWALGSPENLPRRILFLRDSYPDMRSCYFSEYHRPDILCHHLLVPIRLPLWPHGSTHRLLNALCVFFFQCCTVYNLLYPSSSPYLPKPMCS